MRTSFATPARLASVVGAVTLAAMAAGCQSLTGAGSEPPAGDRVSGDPAAAQVRVVRVVDGDTVELADGRTVRMLGIDTPERGDCGYREATAHLVGLVEGKSVELRVNPGDDDVDRYGRLLRYVVVDGVDAGLAQLRGGYANARYDSRDGYGPHLAEDAYITADRRTAHICPALD